MKRVGHGFLLLLLLAVPYVCVAQPNVELSTIRDLDLRIKPLDVVFSSDGQMLFVLAPEEIVVYSFSEMRTVSRLPVDKRFDRLALSPRENTLILSSTSGDLLTLAQLDFIQVIDTAGLPFKGAKDAPVTVAVFSDYQ